MTSLYLDNAATSFPKPEEVYLAVNETLRAGGSPGRGAHRQSLAAGRLLFETRELLGQLFNTGHSDGFVFTANATMALNQALFGILRPGDRVVTTSVEHNSVVRPLRALRELGVEVIKVAADPHRGLVAASELKQACSSGSTRLLAVNHCSNVIGTIQPIEELGHWCREQGILFLVDASQSAGVIPIDIRAMAIDLLAAPGHKGLLGPQGTGFLFIGQGIELKPLLYGGTGTESSSDLQPAGLPERLESGTHNLPGLAGLHAALNWLQQIGVDRIRRHEQILLSQLLDGLQQIDGVTLYGTTELERKSALVSFNLAGYDPAELGFMLDHQYRIAVRVGLHCAPDAHRTIGTFPMGTVRVSPGWFTKTEDIDRFVEVIAKINNNLS